MIYNPSFIAAYVPSILLNPLVDYLVPRTSLQIIFSFALPCHNYVPIIALHAVTATAATTAGTVVGRSTEREVKHRLQARRGTGGVKLGLVMKGLVN